MLKQASIRASQDELTPQRSHSFRDYFGTDTTSTHYYLAGPTRPAMQYTFRQLTSRPDAQGRCRVLLDVTWDNLREKLPTGVSCQPAHFDAAAKLGRTIAKAEPGSSGLNTKLAGLVAELTDLFNKADAHRQSVGRAQVLDLVARPITAEAVVPAAPADPLLTDLLQQWEQPSSSAPRGVSGFVRLSTYSPVVTPRAGAGPVSNAAAAA